VTGGFQAWGVSVVPCAPLIFVPSSELQGMMAAVVDARIKSNFSTARATLGEAFLRTRDEAPAGPVLCGRPQHLAMKGRLASASAICPRALDRYRRYRSVRSQRSSNNEPSDKDRRVPTPRRNRPQFPASCWLAPHQGSLIGGIIRPPSLLTPSGVSQSQKVCE
jgi:hypothetical protein